MARADLDKRPGDVAAMFDALAGRYDLMNDLLSAGQVPDNVKEPVQQGGVEA